MKREGSILSTSVLQLILLIFGSKRTQLFWQNIFGLLLEKKKKKKKNISLLIKFHIQKTLSSDAARISPQVSWLSTS